VGNFVLLWDNFTIHSDVTGDPVDFICHCQLKSETFKTNEAQKYGTEVKSVDAGQKQGTARWNTTKEHLL